MNFLAKNLKFLREIRKLKQAEMLDSIGIAQTTWNNYEKGVSKPKYEDLIKISTLFGVPVDDLLKIDLSKGNLNENEKSKFIDTKGNLNSNPKGNLKEEKPYNNHIITTIISEPESTYKTTPQPRIITVNEHGIDNIIFVPIKAQGGYLSGYADKEYIESLPSFRMPGLNNGTFRMFEVDGISMTPTLTHGDRVICEWVPNLEEIRENRIHVIIHSGGVVVKRVINRVKERQKIYLKSDTLTHRSDYPLVEIDPEDIREIWYVRMKISSDLREPSELYTRVTDLEIKMHEISKKLTPKK
jgi:transcriptional regulator with XRE-family HTH domain